MNEMKKMYTDNQNIFRNSFAESIFNLKYKHEGAETWEELSSTLVDDVCGGLLPQSDIDHLKFMISINLIKYKLIALTHLIFLNNI